MDIATISTAYTGLKYAKDTLSGILRAKVESEVQTRISEVMEKLGQAQDTLFNMREELFHLQTENANLRRDIEAQQNWQERLSQYQLTETAGRAVVYQSKTTPMHYVCPSCIEKREIQILQDRRVASGSFDCPGCKVKFPVKPTSYSGIRIKTE